MGHGSEHHVLNMEHFKGWNMRNTLCWVFSNNRGTKLAAVGCQSTNSCLVWHSQKHKEHGVGFFKILGLTIHLNATCGTKIVKPFQNELPESSYYSSYSHPNSSWDLSYDLCKLLICFYLGCNLHWLYRAYED